MRILLTSAFAMILVAGAASAGAPASVSVTAGSAWVDAGRGFVAVTAATAVSDGSRVLVGQRSKAKLTYADGCELVLSPATITTVSSKIGCRETTQVAGADLTPDEIVAPQDPPAPPAVPAISPWVLAGGAAGLGGVFGYLISDKGEDRYVFVPISR